MSQKIDRNFSCIQCVTKNRFFLILFLICIKRATARAPLSQSELAYYTIDKFPLSSDFLYFFRKIFRKFFPANIPQKAFRFRTACSFYHIKKGKSTDFYNFFRDFSGFFREIFLTTTCCVFERIMVQ